MAVTTEVVVPNRASRWSSIIYWLVWLFGLYGVVATRAWPPGRWQDWATYVALVLLPVLAIRSLRARVVLDPQGLVSHDEFHNQALAWAEVTGFSDRGTPIRNKVGADLADGRWVRLQYHPFAADMVRRLRTGRAELHAPEPASGPGPDRPTGSPAG